MSSSPTIALRRTSYEADRLYHAAELFTSGNGFLLGQRPRVLQVKQGPDLVLPGLSSIGPPADLPMLDRHGGKRPRAQPARAYNPSLARAPPGMCPLCAYVVSLRVDTLHQCSTASSPYNALHGENNRLTTSEWFQATAIGILDSSLRLIRWTWLLNSPSYQIAPPGLTAAQARSAGCVRVGEANAFAPPWAKQTYDARLLNLDGDGLLVTYACSSCVFSVSPMQLTAETTADGGVAELRAWATDRATYQHHRWLAGRNQALFVHVPHGDQDGLVARAPSGPSRGQGHHQTREERRRTASVASASTPTLYVQSRLGLVGSLGKPRFVWRQARCHSRPARAHEVPSPANCRSELHRSHTCGTHPDGSTVSAQRLLGMAASDAQLVANTTHTIGTLLRPAGAYGGLSLTTNLLHVASNQHGSPQPPSPSSPAAPCEAYLGVGHLHRGEGTSNKRMYRRRRSGPPPWASQTPRPARQPFAFGFRYTHFFYTIEAQPPFATLAVSPEFCLASPSDPNECESVQFISGLAHRASRNNEASSHSAHNRTSHPARPTAHLDDELIVSYGVNDCEARVATLPLTLVWSMLQPLARGPPHAPRICTPMP